jgi:hypothetical protein
MAYHIATSCGRPTAPIEKALERYITRVGAGPLEAQHLRQEMLSAARFDRTIGMRVDCVKADGMTNDLIQGVELSKTAR